MKKIKFISLALVLVMIISMLAGCSSGGEKNGNSEGGYKIAVVAKTISSGWFQRMKDGVDAYNAENGTDYYFGGPVNISDQTSYLEQLLAEDWHAICVVPFDPESIAPLLEKAREEGIVVICHEADSMISDCYDYDIEAFLPDDLGTHYAEVMVEKTGGEGTYIQFVESLNSVNHNGWCNAADAYIAANSNLIKLGRYETNSDITSAYNQTKELLQSHPEINVIEGSAASDIPGVAKAIEELGLAGKVTIVGTSLSSFCGEYVENGTISTFSLWDPAEAGKAMLSLAENILADKENFDINNTELDGVGYDKLIIKGNLIYANARADVTKENLSEFDY